MIALLLLLLAAAPAPESAGSVDGPFLWVDARSSVDGTQFQAGTASSMRPLSGTFTSGVSVLTQQQLFAAWGLHAFEQRFVLGLSLSATEVLTDGYVQSDFAVFYPRFDLSPVALSASVPITFGGVSLESRCRMPVAREFWRAGASVQAEYWFGPELSIGCRIGLEARSEATPDLVILSETPEGSIGTASWMWLDR